MEFLDLNKVKNKNSVLFKKTLEWTKTLTPELDFETGESFTKFIKRNLELKPPYGVFVFYDPEIKEPVGIASIVPDDMNVGRENNLDGIWIAGVNVRREFRNRGYGKMLFEKIGGYLNNFVPLKVNLFASNPYALEIYKKSGFKEIGLNVVRHNKEQKVLSKSYY